MIIITRSNSIITQGEPLCRTCGGGTLPNVCDNFPTSSNGYRLAWHNTFQCLVSVSIPASPMASCFHTTAFVSRSEEEASLPGAGTVGRLAEPAPRPPPQSIFHLPARAGMPAGRPALPVPRPLHMLGCCRPHRWSQLNFFHYHAQHLGKAPLPAPFPA